MREFTFAVTYERGADPLMDLFIEHPELAADSMDGLLASGVFWRIERLTGPRAALDAVERLRADRGHVGESIGERTCEASVDRSVIEREPDRRVVYSFVEDLDRCVSVHTLAEQHLDPGVLFETRREGNRYEWRLLLRSDHNVGLFYDALTGGLRDGLTFHTGHLRDAESWQHGPLGRTELPGKQRVALREAFDRGYYETPRGISLEELADELGVPRSTLSYRLRRAEAGLVRSFVGTTTSE